MLYLKCQGQVVSIDVDERLADKYINANTVHWEFCERWADMVITAQFTQVQKNEETGKDEKRTFNVLVDEVTNTTTMPNEIVAGDVDISAFGEHPVTGVRITTVPIKKRVDKSGFVGDGEIPIPPTPDLYSQLIGRINENSIPYIGENGNWWVGEHDSGVVAAEIEESIEAAERAESAAAKAEAANENIEETVTDLRHDIDTLADTIAILHAGVPDTSAKAASHELYATDASMNVTLYGATYQAGEGDPSPDNVRPISGVDAACVHCGGKNLIPPEMITFGSSWNIYVAKNEGLLLSAGTYCFSYKGAANASGIYVRDPETNAALFYKYSTKELVFTLLSPSRVFLDVYGEPLDKLTIDAVMLNVGSTALPYEPYNANVIDMTAALNGEALHGNGTVSDTVENDVLSGCDCCVQYDGSADEAWSIQAIGTRRILFYVQHGMPGRPVSANSSIANMYSDGVRVESTSENDAVDHTSIRATTYDGERLYYAVPNSVFTDVNNPWAELSAYLAAHPFKVYYRSTEYTPDKDLRVCKVVRRCKSITLDGSADEGWTNVTGNVWQHNMPVKSNANPAAFKTSWLNVQAWAVTASTQVEAGKFAVHTGGTAIYINVANAPDVLAANPLTVVYELATSETYMTDPIELRKPVGLMPVTVTGSGETEVAYSCDTKSYIDRKFDALAAALIGG